MDDTFTLETWILPHDIAYLATISDDFASTGTSAINVEAGLLRGRPYGGTALLWRKSAFQAVSYKCSRDKLMSLQRGFAICAIRGFRTLNTYTAIVLSCFTPICDKIKETSDIELTRITQLSSFVPHDIALDSPVPPADLLHPSLRKAIMFREVNNTGDLENTLNSRATALYTDGSKHDAGVGAAVVIFKPSGQQITKKFKLHSTCSVFQAELLAIKHACDWVLKEKATPSVILSDSKSSLMELMNPNSRCFHAVQIFKNLHLAQSLGIEVSFIWLRAHVGIAGNEAADIAAKAAATLRVSPEFDKFPLSHVRHFNKSNSLKGKRELFENPEHCTYLKQWCPDFNTLETVLNIFKPNFCFTQLFSNHGYHNQLC
ncbi:RNase H domain-containing protein [Phthorimaea operculella]|nr:RNase H domain-containing protein [Phthorimaea operculella]